MSAEKYDSFMYYKSIDLQQNMIDMCHMEILIDLQLAE